MRIRLYKYWDDVRSSYWFIPTLMVLGALVASFGLVTLDSRVGDSWLQAVPWLYYNRPAGARELLSTIAGSMITVAGVTFSITIAAVAYATQQFGPRLLTNFMRDRGNQVTLGTFIATFLYCLMVLRTIRSADESETAAEAIQGAFIPHIALMFALVLALASIGVLIFFIHHVPESILASNVIATVGKDLNKKISTLFPAMIGYGVPDEEEYDPQEDVPEDFFSNCREVRAAGSGYVQYVDNDRLIDVARRNDLLLRLAYRPGDFVNRGKVFILAYPAERVSDDVAHALHNAFAWGRRRTQAQDLTFLANELIEISMRALSPSLNDPFTAMNCVDWLGSALINFADKSIPTAFRYDEDRRLRVIARPLTFNSFADEVFDKLRPYVAADENTILHMLRVMGEVMMELENDQYRQVVYDHARVYRDAAFELITTERVREQIEARHRVIARIARNPDQRREIGDEVQWLSGSA